MINPDPDSARIEHSIPSKGDVMFFWNRKKEEPSASPAPRLRVSTEKLLSEAYRIGKYSPTNCECPPAPNIIPVWIENNVEAFELYVERLYAGYDIPRETEPALFLAMFDGFRDLIRNCPDAGSSPFCMSREEVIEVSKSIFVKLAEKRGILLDLSQESVLTS
jgi:hypothetical protein